MSIHSKVSIVVISYNQQDFIKKAIESFLLQKIDFAIEIIIADDASTDDTQKVIKGYAKKHPEQFKPILRKVNIGIQRNLIDALQHAEGDYIALCEGDDFWTDPEKLQRQVDFLDNHPQHALCFHPVNVFFENNEQEDYIYPKESHAKEFTLNKLLKTNFIQTNSVMYRRRSYRSIPDSILPLDWYLHLYHAQFGKIGYINTVMASYRRHAGGVWWESYSNGKQLWKKYGIQYLGVFVEVLKLYETNGEYRDTIESSIVDMFNRLLQVDINEGTDLLTQACHLYPKEARMFIEKQNESLKKNELLLNKNKTAIYRLSTDLSRSMEGENNIKSSRSFILGYYLSHPWNLPRTTIGWSKKLGIQLSNNFVGRLDLRQAEDLYTTASKTLTNHTNKENKKIAVVLHLYYTDLWAYFVEKLEKINPDTFDLFVSIPEGKASFVEKIRKNYPHACIIVTPNRGRDVLPFMIIINAIKNKGYVSLLKIHSKKSKHRTDGNQWLTGIIDSLVPESPQLLKDIILTLDDTSTGVIGTKAEYVSLAVNYEANKYYLRRIMKSQKSSEVCERVDANRYEYGFFAGTMFWARMDAVDSLVVSQHTIGSFEAETGQVDNTLAHAIERLLCLIPELDDKNIYSVDTVEINKIDKASGMIPEWSDVHMG